MLGALLTIKARREERLRRLLSTLKKQQQEIQVDIQAGQTRRERLHSLLGDMLSWSGTLAAGEWLTQKHKMAGIFHQQHELALEQQSLLNKLSELAAQRQERAADLRIIMKKKEKIGMILADEYV